MCRLLETGRDVLRKLGSYFSTKANDYVARNETVDTTERVAMRQAQRTCYHWPLLECV